MKFEYKMINPKELAEEAMDGALIEVKGEEKTLREWTETVLDWIDAEAQGLLLRLPCKVGDRIWIIFFIPDNYPVKIAQRSCIKQSTFTLGFYANNINEFGKTIFLTKEEAEAKLAELRGAK